MRFKKLKAAGVIAAVAMCVTGVNPAAHASGGTSIVDPDGVDYDAACISGLGGKTTPPPPNSIKSPGGTSGCPLSAYDGSSELTDLRQVSLSTTTTGDLLARFTVDGRIPAAGSRVYTDGDLPAPDFNGATFYAMFQNATVQTNLPTNSKGGGCARVGGSGQVYDQPNSWKDGYHFFVAFSVVWDGTKWTQYAAVGKAKPKGGSSRYESAALGANDGSGWVSADPVRSYGNTWSVTSSAPGASDVTVQVAGIVPQTDTLNCADGVFNVVYATPGDRIVNVKGVSTADTTVLQALPVSVDFPSPLPVSNVATIGGFTLFSDVTEGNSTPGLGNTNITGVSLTGGLVGGTDTVYDGPNCPTPTLGGVLPANPLFGPDSACEIDDDSISRGSFLNEWWDTQYGFTA